MFCLAFSLYVKLVSSFSLFLFINKFKCINTPVHVFSFYGVILLQLFKQCAFLFTLILSLFRDVFPCFPQDVVCIVYDCQ